MIRRFVWMVRHQWAGLLALFLVLTGGTAMAIDGSLPGQNTVGSADIINGEVAAADLGAASVASGKILDGQVKNQDLGAGASNTNTIADGGVQGIDVRDNTLKGADIDEATLSGFADTSVRAYGHVDFDGTITRDSGVVGEATGYSGSPTPNDGQFCITLDPSIDAQNAVVVANLDNHASVTFGDMVSFVEPTTSDLCDEEQIFVQTGYFGGNPPAVANQTLPFFFVVP